MARGERSFHAFVARSDDQRLERTIGSRLGLRVLFAVLQSVAEPDPAGDITGELCCELRTGRGELRVWTLEIVPGRVRARPGRGEDPRLTMKLSVADLVRIAGRDLDVGEALLTGRVDLEGDFTLALRLGELFDRS